MSRTEVLKFAKSHGYVDVEYVCVMGKAYVYNPIYGKADNNYFPEFIFVEGDKIRLTEIKETEEVMNYLDEIYKDSLIS